MMQLSDGKLHEFEPAQGDLLRPYTFDVQNIRDGWVSFSFPGQELLPNRKYVLFFPGPGSEGFTRVVSHQSDQSEFIYRVPTDGWFVFHYPYDNKWKIAVDGSQVHFYKVNKSFIGFPISQGEHKILIQFWPRSPLRALLLVSALLTTLGLPALIFLAFRWERRVGHGQ